MLKNKVLVLLLVIFLVGCGGGNSNKSNIAVTTSPNIISGVVDDDPVEGAEVYIDFGDSNSTKAITGVDGSYKIVLSSADLAKINPTVAEGADGPKDNLLLVAHKKGKVLRNALSRDVSNGQIVYVTNDTEAYAQYLESIGKFDTVTLTEFNNEIENGRIKDSSDKASFIKDIREDVKTYFYGGEKPTFNTLFTKAMTHLGKDKVAKIADNSSYISVRSVMSGGDIILPSDLNVSSDDITITNKGNGKYMIGNGNDSSQTVYIKIENGGNYNLIPIEIKQKIVTQLASQTVTPQNGANLGNSSTDSISVVIPPFALNEEKEITFNKVTTEGETLDGKMILDMQPSGLTFDMPITVAIKYSDFGIDDPNAVEWRYGSTESGYESADILNIDTTNKLIYLNVSHFSNLVVRSISGQQFLDLGHNFIIHIPRRDIRYYPTNNNIEMITQSQTMISNKLFENSSISNLNGVGNIGGGQCVQFASNFYYPLKYGIRPKGSMQASSLLKKLDISHNGYRTRIDDCQEGDIVAMSSIKDTGHVGIFKSFIQNTNNQDYNVTLIQSNSYLSDIKLGNPIRNLHSERFGIGLGTKQALTYRTVHMNQYSVQNDFVCLGRDYFEDEGINDINNFKKTNYDSSNNNYNKKTFSVTWEPWKYYLISDIGNGITRKNNNYLYTPDLLPVTPLKVDFNESTNIGKILSTKDARYEIYSNIDNLTMSNGNMLEQNSSKTLNFNNNNLSLMYTKRDNKIVEQLMMSDGNIWHNINSTTQGNILFSPTVIDDYYIDWNGANPQIGFKNSKTYNLDFAGEYTTNINLEPNKVYSSEEALNGYFIALGQNEIAKWFFALVGSHSVFVNIPTGKITDIQNATYYLHLNNSETGIEMEMADLNASKRQDSDFRNWFPLRAKDSKKTSFEFTGNDYLEVKAKNGTIVVDAIRLDVADYEEYMVEANVKVDLSDDTDYSQRVCKLDISSKTSATPLVQKDIAFGKSYIVKLSKALNKDLELKFIYQDKPMTGVGSIQSRSVRTTNTSTYKPQIQNIIIPAGTTVINLPSVVLYKDIKKDTLQIKAINATNSSGISNANIIVRFGLDREDNSIAYSGTTDSHGLFTINNIPYGQYSVAISKNGFISTNLNLTVNNNTPTVTDLSISPVLTDSETRIRLTWGENPQDLDSHLVKKTNSIEDYHIYYDNQIAPNGDSLDLDDTDGQGPETSTISNVSNSSVYTYYVDHFMGISSIKNSRASVKISSGSTEKTYYPPNEDGKYWKVFEIENGIIKPCISNCMADDTTSLVRAVNSSSKDFEIFKNLPAKYNLKK